MGREASFQHADVITGYVPHARTPLHFGRTKGGLQVPWSEGQEEVFVAVALLPVLPPALLQRRHPALLLPVGVAWPFQALVGVGWL